MKTLVTLTFAFVSLAATIVIAIVAPAIHRLA